MAEITNGNLSPEKFNALVAQMSEPELIAQDLVHQGARHALAWLLEQGCTPQAASNMLLSLRGQNEALRAVAARRNISTLIDWPSL